MYLLIVSCSLRQITPRPSCSLSHLRRAQKSSLCGDILAGTPHPSPTGASWSLGEEDKYHCPLSPKNAPYISAVLLAPGLSTLLFPALKQTSREVTTLNLGILQGQLPRPALLQEEKKTWMPEKAKQRCSEHCPSNCSTRKTLNSGNNNCRPRPRRLSQSRAAPGRQQGRCGSGKGGTSVKDEFLAHSQGFREEGTQRVLPKERSWRHISHLVVC